MRPGLPVKGFIRSSVSVPSSTAACPAVEAAAWFSDLRGVVSYGYTIDHERSSVFMDLLHGDVSLW